MKVLALTSYPTAAAATRYRLQQFVAPLAERGITLVIHPFIDSKLFEHLYRRNSWPQTAIGLVKAALRRPFDVFAARHADVVMIQREAMLLETPIVTLLAAGVM